MRTGTEMDQKANFILLVENDATFMPLNEEKFRWRFSYIIVCRKGQPDVPTRLFLRELLLELKLHVLGLMDCDLGGLKIFNIYGHGLMSMSYDSLNLVTPNLKWLGFRPSDLDQFKVSDRFLVDLTKSDVT